MNYITPDIEVKRAFSEFENLPVTQSLSVQGFNLYAVSRFFLEMKYRNRYYEKLNQMDLPVYRNEHQNDQTEKVNDNILRKIAGKFSGKVKHLQFQQKKTAFYKQFDLPASVKDKTDVLFLATSAYKNKHNYSLELEDLIVHSKQSGKKISFALPDYNYEIRRRPEYDYFFGLNLRRKLLFKNIEKDTIEEFRKAVLKHFTLLESSDVADFESFFSSVMGQSEELYHLLVSIQPRFVVARSLYSDKWVTMACQLAGVQSIEIQHGTFTSDNFYYHSLSSMNHSSLLLPDFVLCLGKDWLEILKKQSGEWNGENSGLLGTSLQLQKSTLQRNKINVLIAFQDFSIKLWEIRPEIYGFLNEHAGKLPEFNFIVRVHPADTLESLQKFPQHSNIGYSDPKMESTSEVLKKTDVLICATSMMMYEALNFGIPVISLERFRKMTEEKGISFIESAEDLYDCLKNKKYFTGEHPEYLSKLDFTFFDKLTLNRVVAHS